MNNYLLPLLGDCGGQVIWAILLTNMGHITNQYGPYYSPTPNPIPKGGGPKGFLIRHIRLISLIRPISPKKTPSLWGRLKGTHK